MKYFYLRFNVGKSKYTVNFHDGVSTHKDGSEFVGIKIFSNKKKMASFLTGLRRDGYVER